MTDPKGYCAICYEWIGEEGKVECDVCERRRAAAAEPQDWRTLRAGRALDLLVAERVMGARWVHHRSGTARGGWVRFLSDCPEEDGYYETALGDEEIGDHHVRLYSTDVSAAWKVVERFAPMLYLTSGNGTGNRWCCSFVPDGGVCVAPTAPLAICRAALAAVEARP